MPEQLSTDRRAERAWCIAGRAVNALQSMSAEEIESLSDLTDATGSPVEGFRAKFDEFMEQYLENRKVTVDESAAHGFNQAPEDKSIDTNEE